MTNTFNGMYQRDSNKAFKNAKSKGLDKPNEYMYMYSKGDNDYFKNKDTRHYETVKRGCIMK